MMKRSTKVLGFVSALTFGACSLQTLASAGELPFELPALVPYRQMTVYDLPNVPDAYGCVKMCVRDDSPCDPWNYKRADNRCRNVD